MFFRAFLYLWIVISLANLAGFTTNSSSSLNSRDDQYVRAPADARTKTASWGEIKSTFNNGGDIDDGKDGKRDKD